MTPPCDRCGSVLLVRKSKILPRDYLSLRRCRCAFLCRICRLVGIADHMLDELDDDEDQP